MGTMCAPAFLLPLLGKRVQQCCYSRNVVCMTSDKAAEPTNAKPSSLRRSEPSTSRTEESGAVVSMAIADEWNTDEVHRRFLQNNGTSRTNITRYGPVLHISQAGVDVFTFPYGCIVIWGGGKCDEEYVRKKVRDTSVGFRQTPIVTRTRWTTGGKNPSESGITVDGAAKGLQSIMERLAISCALAQVVKLRALEEYVRDAMQTTRYLSEELAKTGEISIPKKDVSKLSGNLFLEKFRYQLSGDDLGATDFFLDNEQYLRSYRRMERHFEMRERLLTVTARLEALQGFYQLLSEEITHHYSIGLELAITVMIAFELFISLMALAKQSLRSAFTLGGVFSGVMMILWVIWRIWRKRSANSALHKFRYSSGSWG